MTAGAGDIVMDGAVEQGERPAVVDAGAVAAWAARFAINARAAVAVTVGARSAWKSVDARRTVGSAPAGDGQVGDRHVDARGHGDHTPQPVGVQGRRIGAGIGRRVPVVGVVAAFQGEALVQQHGLGLTGHVHHTGARAGDLDQAVGRGAVHRVLDRTGIGAGVEAAANPRKAGVGLHLYGCADAARLDASHQRTQTEHEQQTQHQRTGPAPAAPVSQRRAQHPCAGERYRCVASRKGALFTSHKNLPLLSPAAGCPRQDYWSKGCLRSWSPVSTWRMTKAPSTVMSFLCTPLITSL